MHFNSFKDLKKTLLIAEIGNNHEGKIKNAFKLIDKAQSAGADVVKFQHIIPSNLVHFKEKKRIKFLKKICLSINDYKKLSIYAKKKGLLFSITPFDENYIEELNKFVDIFKIASSDNNYISLINKVMQTKKKLIISTGMMSFDEIMNLYKHIKKSAFDLNKICFLHCISNYPAEFEEVNLNFLLKMKKSLKKISIGYSDHTKGIIASIAAFTYNISVIEKHFTLDKNFSSFRDHKLSADEKELKILKDLINNFEILKNNKKKNFMKLRPDLKNKINLRRSIYLKNDVKKNQIISQNDLLIVRPNIYNNLNNLHLSKKIKAKFNMKKGSVLKIKN